MGVFHACIYVHLGVWCQKKALDSRELEIKVVLSQHVGVWN